MTRIRNLSLTTDRRALLRGAGLAATTLLAAPWVWRKAEAAGEVNVLAFGGYEEPGMLEPFSEATGIKVNLKIHDGSDEEMVALMASSAPGTFDVITPTSAYVPRAAQDGILHELDPADYPLDDYFSLIAGWPPCFMDGKMYGLVNRFGYYGITYNKDKYSSADVASYAVLFDGKAKGRVALFDWFLPNMGCLAKSLGFAQPYDLDAAQMAKLEATLTSLRPQVGLVGNTSQVIQAMAGGSYDLAIAGEWVQAGMYDDGLPFLARVPQEGGVTWDQAVCISAKTPRYDQAKAFVQYVAGPEFQSRLAVAKTYYSMVPNKKAAALLPQDKRELLNLADLEGFDKNFMANLSPRKDPANREEWLKLWEAFKNA